MKNLAQFTGNILHRVSNKLSNTVDRPAKATPTSDLFLRVEYGFDNEVDAKIAVAKVRGNTMTSLERLVSLWNQVNYLDRHKIEGSLVECGVWRGGSMGMMALAHLHANPSLPRELHLFDSFEGLPEPDSQVDGQKAIDYSNQAADAKLASIGRCVGPIEDNKKLLLEEIKYPKNQVHFHQGWFEETVPVDAPKIGKIALLRLDGDWYSSTKVCLDHLYSRVAKHGVIVVDDYGHWEGCRKAVDEFLLKSGEPVMLHHVDYTGRYWIKTTD